ncbi:GerAB/ArcD/ProY family transporter [Alicyclobacillus sp. TC]|uniref:GerAB/ArcD/ProY family transporter n=1 Tax=Alicyclobacillus sp. TC TaxID=2606450 RepID=UPI001934B5BD|nr:GerAB/ArcD/ProY family transporter [Alicyclobacillus sp. TC]QRF24159.1 GerAB/ArcD/ProY family transporter [Alicyclobacillus sp. TC]
MLKLTHIQAICLLSTSFLPLLFWVFPRYAVSFSGIDGQWAILGVCMFGILSAVLHGWINKTFYPISGGQIGEMIFGKWLGRFFTLSYIPGYILFVSLSLFSFSLILKSILPNTPRFVIVSSMGIVAMIGALYGLETLASSASLIFPIILGILCFSCINSLIHAHWTGIFYHPVNLQQSLFGAEHLFPIFLGFSLYLILNPYVIQHRRESFSIPLLSMAFATGTLILIYVTSVVVIGYSGIQSLTHPTEFVLQLAQLQGLLVERFGIVFVSLVTFFEVVFFSNHLWGLSETIMKSLNLSVHIRAWLVVGVTVAVISVFQVVPNQQAWDNLVNQVLFPLSWFYLIGQPILILSTYHLRKALGKGLILTSSSSGDVG